MDYYYVGTGSPVGGLQDAYFKVKYQSNLFSLSADVHNFQLAQNMVNTLDADKNYLKKDLGYEFDFIANYALNKFTTLELGYAFMLANNSTEYVKKSTMDATNHRPTWAYLMINIRPDFFFAKPVAIKQ